MEPSFVFIRDKENEDLDSQIRKIQRLGIKAPIEFVDRKDETNDSRPYNVKEDQAIFALINFLNVKYKLNDKLNDFFTLIKEANLVDKRTVQIISDHIAGRDVGSIRNRLVNVIYKNRFIYTKPTFLFEIVLEHKEEKESKHVSKMITILTQTHMIVLKCKTPNGPSCIGNHPDISITMEYDSNANFGIDEGLLYEFLLKNANVKVPTNLEMFKSFMTKNGIRFHANSTWHIQNPFFIASSKKVSQSEADLNLEKVTSEESYSDLDFRIGQIESILQNLRTPEEKHELKMLKARKRKRVERKKVDDFLMQSSKNKLEREQQLAKLKDGTEKQKLDLKTEMENIILKHENKEIREDTFDDINFQHENNEIKLFLKKKEEVVVCQPDIKSEDISSEVKEELVCETFIKSEEVSSEEEENIVIEPYIKLEDVTSLEEKEETICELNTKMDFRSFSFSDHGSDHLDALNSRIRKIESKLRKLMTPEEKFELKKLKERKRRCITRLKKEKSIDDTIDSLPSTESLPFTFGTYNLKDMASAYEAVKSGKIQSKMAIKYKVPKRTLDNYVSGKTNIEVLYKKINDASEICTEIESLKMYRKNKSLSTEELAANKEKERERKQKEKEKTASTEEVAVKETSQVKTAERKNFKNNFYFSV